MLQLKTLPIQKTQITAPLFFLGIAFCCYFLSDQLSEYFIYHRIHIIEHQYWRLLTGHLFHTNYAHLLLNTLAIILLWALHGKFYTTRLYCLLFVSSALIISLAIFYLSPEMTQYVGLSGVLHAFFIWGALKDIQHHDKTGYMLLIGFILKIGHEQIYGASEEVATLINASVAIEAHFWGGVSGVMFFIFTIAFNKYSVKINNVTSTK